MILFPTNFYGSNIIFTTMKIINKHKAVLFNYTYTKNSQDLASEIAKASSFASL